MYIPLQKTRYWVCLNIHLFRFSQECQAWENFFECGNHLIWFKWYIWFSFNLIFWTRGKILECENHLIFIEFHFLELWEKTGEKICFSIKKCSIGFKPFPFDRVSRLWKNCQTNFWNSICEKRYSSLNFLFWKYYFTCIDAILDFDNFFC